MTSTRPDPPVPDEATVKLYTAIGAAHSARHEFGEPARWEHPDSAEHHARAIAAPVVAAVLRQEAQRLAEATSDNPWEHRAPNIIRAGALGEAVRRLRDRAAEIES